MFIQRRVFISVCEITWADDSHDLVTLALNEVLVIFKNENLNKLFLDSNNKSATLAVVKVSYSLIHGTRDTF